MAESKSLVELTFSGLQTFAAIATLGLASWVVFFTPLPEMLEKQLRTEVVEAKEEAINIRRVNNVLLDEQTALRANNQEMISAAETLRGQLASLETERAALSVAIEKLRSERSAYASATSGTVAAQVLAYATYELDVVEAIATICARYDEHRKWLDAQRKLRTLDKQIDELPFDERFDQFSALGVERDILWNVKLPDFWFGINPPEPSLVPRSGGNQLLTEMDIAILNGMGGDPEALHGTLIKELFDRIVDASQTGPVTGQRFIENVKSYPMIAELLPIERNKLLDDLGGFLTVYPDLQVTVLSVNTDREPDATEIVAMGQRVLPSIERFRSLFLSYLASKGWAPK